MNVPQIQQEIQTENDSDEEINPCTMLLIEQHQENKEQDTEAAAAKDEVHVITHHLNSIKSNVVIRQLPSQGISFKLWPAASTLVSLLDNHRNAAFSALFDHKPLRILELGSGTGLVGIAAAAILGAHVTVTDLSRASPNLQFNVEANLKTIGVNGGHVEVAAMAWGNDEEMEAVKNKGEYDVIMGSDLVYHDHLYEPLLRALRFFMLGDEVDKERVFVMAHSKRWKKESVFFKKAYKEFDVKVLHRDDPCDGDRIGILVCTFVAKNKNKKNIQVLGCE
ncbi:hypothetical protein DCAR_0729408 [Daucus carota subsp. sativus]|uniref:Uncharacterized protein n=1 Tax=Daucus carota subsp. sativus TaxID=79200 RepID=A0A161Y7S3_DAUCS|nr:PREDICTED: protein N-lysine methyltransferase METTL21A-like [Daucus carota subsp. sativus]WOH09947.1 hypothetical protein DCAR_0729408 [Daucus carota subsp. sativus]